MRRSTLVPCGIAAAWLSALGCAAASPSTEIRPASQRQALRAAIDSMVESPRFRNAHWGVLIVDPLRGDTIYSRNAGKLFLPASNMKIVTGAVALAELGSDFRFRTMVAARGTVRGGVLAGDLIVHGRGDPSFSDSMRTSAVVPMREMADSLAARGIRRLTGRVLRGSDVFPDASYGFGWSWDELGEPYSAGVDELILNEGFGRITVRAGPVPGAPPSVVTMPVAGYPPVRILAVTSVRRDTTLLATTSLLPAAPAARLEIAYDSASGGLLVTGSLAVGDSVTRTVAYRDQPAALLAALRQAMGTRGIEVGGAVVTPAPREDTLFAYQSPPLRDILRVFEKPSQNQVGEILLKTLGLERTGVGTADSGRRVVESWLAAWGAEPDGFVVRDGSGLSRYNYLSPETIVRTLDAMRRHPDFRIFYDALAVAGVDGTIRSRMRGTRAEGNVHAKTGTLANARSLSGYVTTADGRMLLFSVLCNNWTVPVREINAVQDAIAVALASLDVSGAGR
ncbi:MAG: D-alanyl-D-alanine carboxypeptidase/D-alanyl-D-alanine endopeptidase [Gemmatimonadaceae bacterium]